MDRFSSLVHLAKYLLAQQDDFSKLMELSLALQDSLSEAIALAEKEEHRAVFAKDKEALEAVRSMRQLLNAQYDALQDRLNSQAVRDQMKQVQQRPRR